MKLILMKKGAQYLALGNSLLRHSFFCSIHCCSPLTPYHIMIKISSIDMRRIEKDWVNRWNNWEITGLPSIGWFSLGLHEQTGEQSCLLYPYWNKPKIFSYFFLFYWFPHPYFISYLCSANPTQVLIFFIEFGFSILTMVFWTNIIRSWINRKIYPCPISLFLYFIQMLVLGSPDSLWQKKYLI